MSSPKNREKTFIASEWVIWYRFTDTLDLGQHPVGKLEDRNITNTIYRITFVTMSAQNSSNVKNAVIAGITFTTLAIIIDILFHFEVRWKDLPAWLIAGLLFGISWYFYTKKNS